MLVYVGDAGHYFRNKPRNVGHLIAQIVHHHQKCRHRLGCDQTLRILELNGSHDPISDPQFEYGQLRVLFQPIPLGTYAVVDDRLGDRLVVFDLILCRILGEGNRLDV